MKKYFVKIANFSGWILLSLLVFYFVSGYAIVHKYGMDSLMNNSQAWFWHKYLTIPFFVFLLLHIVPYFVVRKQVKKLLLFFLIAVAVPILSAVAIEKTQPTKEKPQVKTEQESKTVQCPNCPKGCVLKPGETGDCGQFENKDGILQPKVK